MDKGFLGTAAPQAADLTLLAESAMGLALIMGAMLARRGWYRAHGWCQSFVVLLNLVVIALYMVPSFCRQVVPAIPADLGDSAYILAVAHGSAGLTAELLLKLPDGRGRRGTHPGDLRRELPQTRGDQEEVRPGEPVPRESQHSDRVMREHRSHLSDQSSDEMESNCDRFPSPRSLCYCCK